MSNSMPGLENAFSRVDAQPDPTMLVAGMDATARWPAVRRLRGWEREQLALQPGERVLDVGCGTGQVALDLAAEVAPDGAVVGIDASDAMLDEARRRAAEVGADVAFRRGDALALDEPDASFDASRAERTLQWVPDAAAAVAELTRVLRPGGRLALIDTDWRTFTMDLPDAETASAVLQALATMRGPTMAIGGRLLNLCRDAGLTGIDGMCATHVWTEWDPDTEPSPPGLFPIRPVIGQLVQTGALDADTGERFIEQAEDAARRDRLFMSVTLVAVTGRKAGA